MRKLLFILSLGLSLSCKNDASQPQLPQGTPTPNTYFTAQMTDKTFYVADHFFASIEMQISGEPFAQLLGRNLAGYDRFTPTPDLYVDPATGQVWLGGDVLVPSYVREAIARGDAIPPSAPLEGARPADLQDAAQRVRSLSCNCC